MNKRAFIKRITLGAVGFSILPSAVTYTRQWKPLASGIYVDDSFYAVLKNYQIETFIVPTPFYSAWQNLLEKRQWTSNMGNVMRASVSV